MAFAEGRINTLENWAYGEQVLSGCAEEAKKTLKALEVFPSSPHSPP
jgi:hypothetical protein